MIPFGSQRALGQDLATHLMNTHDNERMELVDVRGSVAKDLHGAFAEWEIQAHALTRCKNYLYSLSINPDPAQGPLTREQYDDYITRVENKLGLEGQPRAIVMHVKDGREHAHVVWSRIDAEAGKAVQIAFDREKLMMVTRQFARDHGLDLPGGYDRDGHGHDQLSLYEKAQQDKTGVTKEERIAHVTEAWQQSDSPKAFVRALEERGYILATGKRPYVLVDIYGEMNALPKLIDDRSVRTKDIRAFLEKDFPAGSLPSVEEARNLAEQHRKAREAFVKSQRSQDKATVLKERQAKRRETAQKDAAALKVKQAAETLKLASRQQDETRKLEGRFKDEMDRIRRQREANRSPGLAAFLGRVTGMNFLIKAIRARQDARRQHQHEQEKQALSDHQQRQRQELAFRQRMQRLSHERRLWALDRLEVREMKSLTTKQLAGERAQERDGFLHLPTLGRKQRDKAAERDGGDDRFYPDIQDDFTRAAGPGHDHRGDDGGGDHGGRDFRSLFKNRRNTPKKSPGKSKGDDRDR